MVRHFLDPAGGDATPAQNIGKERPDVVEPEWTPEGDDEDGIEWLRHARKLYGSAEGPQAAKAVYLMA